jgi:hypothetical protein
MFPFPVCDDACKEVVMDPTNELLVCTISGHCFDRLLSPSEMEPDAVSINFFYPFFFLFGMSQLLSNCFSCNETFSQSWFPLPSVLDYIRRGERIYPVGQN